LSSKRPFPNTLDDSPSYGIARFHNCFGFCRTGYYCQSSLICDSPASLPSPLFSKYIGDSRQPEIQPKISRERRGRREGRLGVFRVVSFLSVAYVTEPSFLQGTGIGQYLLYLLAHLPASCRSIWATTPVDWPLDRRVGSGRVRENVTSLCGPDVVGR
jgi:hypothetical protein